MGEKKMEVIAPTKVEIDVFKVNRNDLIDMVVVAEEERLRVELERLVAAIEACNKTRKDLNNKVTAEIQRIEKTAKLTAKERSVDAFMKPYGVSLVCSFRLWNDGGKQKLTRTLSMHDENRSYSYHLWDSEFKEVPMPKKLGGLIAKWEAAVKDIEELVEQHGDAELELKELKGNVRRYRVRIVQQILNSVPEGEKVLQGIQGVVEKLDVPALIHDATNKD